MGFMFWPGDVRFYHLSEFSQVVGVGLFFQCDLSPDRQLNVTFM